MIIKKFDEFVNEDIKILVLDILIDKSLKESHALVYSIL